MNKRKKISRLVKWLIGLILGTVLILITTQVYNRFARSEISSLLQARQFSPKSEGEVLIVVCKYTSEIESTGLPHYEIGNYLLANIDYMRLNNIRVELDTIPISSTEEAIDRCRYHSADILIWGCCTGLRINTSIFVNHNPASEYTVTARASPMYNMQSYARLVLDSLPYGCSTIALLTIALQQFYTAEYDNAIELVSLVSKNAESSGRSIHAIQVLLGRCYIERGDLSYGIGILDEVISSNSNQDAEDALYWKAWAYEENRMYNDAYGAISELIIRDSLAFDAFMLRGTILYKQGSYCSSIEDYTKVIKLDPNNDLAYSNRGLAWRAIGNPWYAIIDYTAAISINSYNRMAYHNRGNIYLALNMLTKAYRDYSMHILHHPYDGELYYSRGIVCLMMDDYSNATRNFNFALSLGYTDNNIHDIYLYIVNMLLFTKKDTHQHYTVDSPELYIE